MSLKRENALAELKNSIIWFSAKNFFNTVNRLKFIYNNIESKSPRDNLLDIKTVFDAYYLDVRKKGDFAYQCSDLIGKIYFELLVLDENQFRSALEDTHSFLILWRRAQKNLFNMSELTRNKEISLKARYYLYCFGYLISVEGSYSNWLKILYRLVCKFEEIPIDLELMQEWKPWKIKKELIEINPEYEVFFDGYYNGHLRNAIGHGDFSYLNDENQMHFQHTQGNFDKIMTIEEFYKNFEKILTISDVGYELILLIRLRDYYQLLKE